MKLFNIGPDYQVELNKEWILMIPEFATLLKRDKGSEGDYRGDKKLKARRELTFIYFDLDFASPLREWEAFDRRQEALRYAGLKESDVDGLLMEAHAVYKTLLDSASRSLRTYNAVVKSLDKLDEYFENIDFTSTDKKGELLHDTKAYLANLKTLKSAYDSVDDFRRRVEEELNDNGGIRGKASLGGKEGKREKSAWQEGSKTVTEEGTKAPQTSVRMSSLASLLQEVDTPDNDE